MTEPFNANKDDGIVEPPKQWPTEVVELYEPVRELGRGGFASVMLARKKCKDSSDQAQDHFVAMKVVGSEKVTHSEVGYAHREMDILKELSHPNIMRLLEFWEPPPSAHVCAAVMALSYAEGPTLKELSEYGGAFSPCFCRAVIAQIVDAIVYCHERAVIHRDIKPDNVVITGASITQDDIWDGPKREQELTASVWAGIRKKWHVTLLDFGLARALTPDDMKRVNMKDDTPANDPDKSISHALKRTMSAVGNAMYAAPEIVNKTTPNRDSTLDNTDTSVHVTDTFSKFISNYSMTADAYSLGCTMRYMLTGVPPDENNDDMADMMQNPIALICMWICDTISRTSSTLNKRKGFRYRRTREIPRDLLRLMNGLTHPKPSNRTSVRAARSSAWINLVLGKDYVPKEVDEVDYLECVLKEVKV